MKDFFELREGRVNEDASDKSAIDAWNKHRARGGRVPKDVFIAKYNDPKRFKVPSGMKFAGAYETKDANGKKHSHIYLMKGNKMNSPVVVYIDEKEWETFPSLKVAKKEAAKHIKSMKESVEEKAELTEAPDFMKMSKELLKHKDKGQFIYAAKQAKKKGDSTFVFAGKTYNCEEVLENENLDEAVNMGPWNRGAINKAMAKAGIKGPTAKAFIAALRKSGTVDEELEESTETLSENYRTLARGGMGAETKNSINVGRGVDFYEPKYGDKRDGKITKITKTGYVVKDEKDGKSYTFTFYDRTKAKEILDRIGKGKYNESVELEEATAKIKTTETDKVASSATRFGLKAKTQGGHVTISGAKGKLNDYLRAIIGRSSYGNASDVTESVELEEASIIKTKGTRKQSAASVEKDRKKAVKTYQNIRKGKYPNVKMANEEAPDLEKMSNELLKHKSKGIDYEKAAAYVRAMYMNSSLTVQDKAMKGLLSLLKNMDLTDRTTITKILKDNGFKVRGGSLVR